MKKLLNNPWIVGLLAASAIVFVAQAALKKRNQTSTGFGYQADFTDDYADDYGDPGEDADFGPLATTSFSVFQALDSLPPDSNPTDPFGTRQAEIITVGTDSLHQPDTRTIHLSAIWIQGENTLVLVNDRTHAVGDSIGEVTIESVTIDGVWLSHPEGREFLTLGGQFNWDAFPQPEGPNPTLAFYEN